MGITLIKEVAAEFFPLSKVEQARFIKFASTRFPLEHSYGYLAEWADRIKRGNECAYAHADSRTRIALDKAGYLEHEIDEELEGTESFKHYARNNIKRPKAMRNLSRNIDREVKENVKWVI